MRLDSQRPPAWRCSPAAHLLAVLSAAMWGSTAELRVGHRVIRPNLCIGLIDPSPVYDRLVSTLVAIQEGRAKEGRFHGMSRSRLPHHLNELLQKRRHLVALHGHNCPGLRDLDHEIARCHAALGPLLLLRNPSAHDIQIGLQSSDHSLLVLLDEPHCRPLLADAPSQPTHRLLHTLLRGYKGEELVSHAGTKYHLPAIPNPTLTIVMAGPRAGISDLLASDLLQDQGIANTILPIQRPDHLPESDYQRGVARMEEGVCHRDRDDRREYAMDTRKIVPNDVVLKLALAFALWRGERHIDAADVDAATRFETECQELKRVLLAEAAQRRLKPDEDQMLAKLKALGPCKWRDVLRKYSDQRTEVHRPVLDRLVASGRVIVDSRDKIRVANGAGETGRFELVTC